MHGVINWWIVPMVGNYINTFRFYYQAKPMVEYNPLGGEGSDEESAGTVTTGEHAVSEELEARRL